MSDHWISVWVFYFLLSIPVIGLIMIVAGAVWKKRLLLIAGLLIEALIALMLLTDPS